MQEEEEEQQQQFAPISSVEAMGEMKLVGMKHTPSVGDETQVLLNSDIGCKSNNTLNLTATQCEDTFRPL